VGLGLDRDGLHHHLLPKNKIMSIPMMMKIHLEMKRKIKMATVGAAVGLLTLLILTAMR
jgi:hypothetical protein